MELFDQVTGSDESREPQQSVLPGLFPVSARNQALYTFSDEDLVKLHSRLFKRSLCGLVDARSSGETQKDVLAWMMRDEEQPGPFSFKFCCQLQGLDPVEMRGVVLRMKQRIERKRHESGAEHSDVPVEEEMIEALRQHDEPGDTDFAEEPIAALSDTHGDERAHVLLESREYNGHYAAA
ncbi:MAG TPA: hypothetical protein VFA48_02515 [Gammaproteobacteria bacterium]|nr:hypothetical protein [Gammaproteobacteria bacterium]